MEQSWKKQKRVIAIAFFCIFIATMSLIFYTVLNMANYNKEITTDLVVESKNTYMKETVENFIIRMETLEADTLASMEDHMLTLQKTVEQNETKIWELEYLKNAINIHNHDTHQLNVLIYDVQSSEIVYEKDESLEKPIYLVDKIDNIKNYSAIFLEVSASQYNVFVYVDWENIFEMTKAKIYTEIHSMNYEKNQYLWVNEIINYEGGDNYAIRLIHPNLPETEGDYLSTNSEDIVGNFPYLDELNGVKEDGEIFFNYYFENLENGNVTEKISYARLYEKYDWVIATGIPLEDLEIHAINVDKNSVSFIIRNSIIIFAIFLIGFFCALYLLLRTQKKYMLNLQNIVKEETEIDMMTGAFSRKFGDKYLKQSFDNFTKTEGRTYVLMIDIDDFKIVNDTYGHATGDVVLEKVAQQMMRNICSKDCFIRWGGEEFVLVILDINDLIIQGIASETVEQVSKMKFEHADCSFSITISIGGSKFLTSDTKYEEALLRADIALYDVKTNGKNNCRFNYI